MLVAWAKLASSKSHHGNGAEAGAGVLWACAAAIGLGTSGAVMSALMSS